jgi:transcriptional regulator with XRE-family HTH domain
MKNPVDSFAAALRAARAKRHLTQRALADNLHMSVRTIIEKLNLDAATHDLKRLHCWQKN